MKIIIFGCGRVSGDFLKILSDDVELIGFSDNNQSLHNKEYNGKIVYPPSQIAGLDFDYIVVASMHFNAIIKQLTEVLGISREKILVFIGTRCPQSVGNDNDIKLKKLLKKTSPNTIGFYLSDIEEENKTLRQLYGAVPAYIQDKYEVEHFNYKEQIYCGIAIHSNLKCMPSYLISTNIAIWDGFSYKEISRIRDIPDDCILKGAYIHGVSYIMLKGDYLKRLPCISWDINANKLTVLGIPKKEINHVDEMENHNECKTRKKLIYIPSALYKLDSETPVMDCGYIEPYIQQLINESDKLALMGLEIAVALSDSDLSDLKFKGTTNVKLISIDSNCFHDALVNADVVITDNSVSSLEYTLFGDAVIHLVLDTPNYAPPRRYLLKGHDNTPIVYCAKSIDEMLSLSVRLLESGDDLAAKRKALVKELSFDRNEVLPERLWAAIADCLKTN